MKYVSTKPHILYAVAILVVGLSFAAVYFYMKQGELKLKNEELAIKQKQVNQQEADKMAKKTAYDKCLSHANSTYQTEWTAQSKRIGRTDNTLPDPYASTLNQRLKDQEDSCLQIFKAGSN